MIPETHDADLLQEGRNTTSAHSHGIGTQKGIRATDIGDLKRAEAVLCQDEVELGRIVDLIPQTIVVLNPEGKAVYANRVALEYMGLSLDEVRADGFRERVFHPEDVQRLREARQKGFSGTVPFENEQRALGKNGKYRWFLIRYNPLLDERGNVVRWYATGTDIQDRKQTETLHAAEKRTLEMIADGASLKDILNHLCASIDVQVAPSVTTVFLMEADGKHLVLTGGPRVPGQWKSAVSPRPVTDQCGLCGKAAFSKRRVIVADVATDPSWPDDYRALALSNGIRAAWSEPLLTKDNDVLGTFALYSHEARVPTEEDLALIKGAGHIARIAIERQRSQEALRNALNEVQRSESKLRRVIDTIPAVVWYGLPDGSEKFFNERWCDYTGLSREESYGRVWKALVHPQDFPSLREKLLELASSEKAGELEARFRRRDGVFRWFLIRVAPFRDETGKLVRWYGASVDIEDRKQAENKLRQDERELRQLIDFLPQQVVVLDKDGALLQANKTMLDYKGFTLEEMKGGGTQERFTRDVHPEDLERVQSERSAGLSRGIPFEMEKRLLGKDGGYRWFLFRYNPVLNESGDIVRWFATATDIEARKQAEDRMRNEAVALREQIDRDSMFEDIVGSSEALRRVLRQVAKVAPSDSTVLILGETGTGKELIARAIHKRSNRAEQAFIGVNCAAIPPSLIASELFGHEKGAFTGATQRRMGRFEAANGGTIFLDEVGDLPPEIQIALLRVLQEREIERVGSNQAIPVDVRVLAATHHDLDALVAEGKFRQDLLYRLSVVPIEMPSLRERADDIPLLIDYFIGRFAKKAGKKFRTIDKKTVQLFTAYRWPGNVRELQNVIERAVILSEGDTFRVDETWLKRGAPQFAGSTVALNGALQRQEKELIEAALAESGGRVSGPGGAATKLGIPRPTLDAKIKRLGINKYRFKLQGSS
jgi:formate hydrogenlyase transcriptional activator